MRLFAKYIFFWLSLLCLGNVSVAQNLNYPVSVTPFFSPNYSTQWSEFYGERLLKVSIIIKDNAQLAGNVKVFARFSLERVGITIQNPADFVPTHGTPLSFGNQVTLSGADLSESFLPQNLVVSGIDDAFLRQGGSLPDGLWTFRITLYEFDAARGYRQISNQGVCNMSVFLGQPPLLLFPARDSEIDSKYIPNVLFQWMPRATSAEGGMASIEYTFQLWQLGDEENENDVGTGKTIFYEETVNSPFLSYDASKTPMVAGKNYAWRVTVKDLGKNNAYENDGKSEVWKFRYGISCKAPTGLSITNVGSGMREIAWDLMPEAASYELRWRQEPKNEEQTKSTTLNYINMLLSSEDIYHFEVRTLCKNAENSPWSETVDYGKAPILTVNVKTATASANGGTDNTTDNPVVFDPTSILVNGSEVDPNKLNALTQELNATPNPTEQRCGVSVVNNSSSCETPATSTYSGTTPFTSLVNSTIYINGYDIRITKVNNNGSGEGLLYFPYLGRRIPVEWNGNTIVKGEGEYGCITSGIVQAQGSDASILTNDLQRQIAALYNNLNEPDSYSGTFGQAIEAMKTLATELATKGTIDKNDPILTKFKSVCSAVNKGTQQWINEINEKVGSNPTQETTALIAAIGSAKTKVLEMLDCGNANNSNVAPVIPKKGPVWDDRFLLTDCNYGNAQIGAAELLTQVDNNKAIFTPPPTNKLTCIVKLSELKTQLGSAINTFVCPDGGLITLADTDELNFYTYDKSLYPNGSILGVKKGNKNYIARLFKSGGGLNFTGFVDYDIWKANGHPPNTSFHSAAPTLKQDLQVWAIEQSEDQQVRNIGLATYSAPYYKQGEINTGSRNRLNYILEQTASSCNFINNAKDATPKDGYSSQAGLEDLKTKLNTYEGLGDVVFKVTDKKGATSYVTKGKIYKPEDAFPKPTNATIFEITEDADGKVGVEGTFKADPTCTTCAGAAQTALTAALENMKAKHGGKIDPKKNVIEANTDYPQKDGLAYQNMSLAEALTAIAKGYNSLVENAKVPLEVWEPNKAFPMKDNWGVITGGIDGAITEGTDKAQLVGMVLTVISNPKKTATDVAKFAKGAVSSWDNAKNLIKTLGQGIVGYDASDFEEGKHAVYKGRGIGKVGGTLAVQAMSGGGLLGIIQNAPDQLDNLATRIANLLQKFKNKLKSLNWTDAEIDDLANRVGQNQKFLDGFDKLGTKTDDFCSEIKSNEVFKNRAIDNPDYIRAFNEYDPNKIYQINNQIPINSGPPNPKLTLSGQTIYFDNNGFPDFTPYVQSVNDKKQFYKIDMQGSYEGGDFAVADAKAGISKKYRDDNNLTWHHHQDGQTMMLVPREINSGIRHTGGNAVVNHNKNNSNNILYFPSPIIN